MGTRPPRSPSRNASHANVIDLVSVLKESLQNAKTKPKASKKERAGKG